MSVIDSMPPDFGTRFDKWVRDCIIEVGDRLVALEAKGAASAPHEGGAANAPEPKEAIQTTPDSFPAWMRPHAATKAKVIEKTAIMGYTPTKEQVLTMAANLEKGGIYSKKQAASIWNCSEKIALAWLFYISHAIQTEYDKFQKTWKII